MTSKASMKDLRKLVGKDPFADEIKVNLRVRVIDKQYPQWYGKAFDVKAIRRYKDSTGKENTWYYITPEEHEYFSPRYYLGQNQIEIISK